jgi:hypothetical protein
MKLKKHWYFLFVFTSYILVGIVFDCLDIGFKEAINVITWKKIFSAAFFSLIMTLIFIVSPKDKPSEKK